MDDWRRSHFFDQDEDPLGPMANLVDIILVFACGLIAALVGFSPDLQAHFDNAHSQQRDLSLGEEMPTAPEGLQSQMQGGTGFESLGQVYRDPKTGKLILIGNSEGN